MEPVARARDAASLGACTVAHNCCRRVGRIRKKACRGFATGLCTLWSQFGQSSFFQRRSTATPAALRAPRAHTAKEVGSGTSPAPTAAPELS